jgi:DNA-binding transcriptional MerR regulator
VTAAQPERASAVDPEVPAGETLRIGELAKRAGITTRTLRYWEEIGLISPSDHRGSGERVYPPAALERVLHIRELQELVGFTLAEIRAVLESDAIIERLRIAREQGATVRRRRLLDEAIVATDALVARIDDRIARLAAFRDERAQRADRLRARAVELDELAAGAQPVKSGS